MCGRMLASDYVGIFRGKAVLPPPHCPQSSVQNRQVHLPPFPPSLLHLPISSGRVEFMQLSGTRLSARKWAGRGEQGGSQGECQRRAGREGKTGCCSLGRVAFKGRTVKKKQGEAGLGTKLTWYCSSRGKVLAKLLLLIKVFGR